MLFVCAGLQTSEWVSRLGADKWYGSAGIQPEPWDPIAIQEFETLVASFELLMLTHASLLRSQRLTFTGSHTFPAAALTAPYSTSLGSVRAVAFESAPVLKRRRTSDAGQQSIQGRKGLDRDLKPLRVSASRRFSAQRPHLTNGEAVYSM
jgi:hypothetical protein